MMNMSDPRIQRQTNRAVAMLRRMQPPAQRVMPTPMAQMPMGGAQTAPQGDNYAAPPPMDAQMPAAGGKSMSQPPMTGGKSMAQPMSAMPTRRTIIRQPAQAVSMPPQGAAASVRGPAPRAPAYDARPPGGGMADA